MGSFFFGDASLSDVERRAPVSRMRRSLDRVVMHHEPHAQVTCDFPIGTLRAHTVTRRNPDPSDSAEHAEAGALEMTSKLWE
jgi:hypothetical protein